MLRNLIKQLPEDQKAILLDAAERGTCQYIEYEQGLFVGVYVTGNPNLKPLETIGVWACGEILAN